MALITWDEERTYVREDFSDHLGGVYETDTVRASVDVSPPFLDIVTTYGVNVTVHDKRTHMSLTTSAKGETEPAAMARAETLVAQLIVLLEHWRTL